LNTSKFHTSNRLVDSADNKDWAYWLTAEKEKNMDDKKIKTLIKSLLTENHRGYDSQSASILISYIISLYLELKIRPSVDSYLNKIDNRWTRLLDDRR